jgi:hypothetical protein
MYVRFVVDPDAAAELVRDAAAGRIAAALVH